MKTTKPNNAEPETAVDAAPDPFDPATLRISGDALIVPGVRKLLVTVPVRKPDKTWWVRTRPGEEYRLDTAVVEIKEDRDGTYLVAPALWPALATESTFKTMSLFTAINRQGVVFLWPCKLPGTDGRIDEWSRSGLEAAERGSTLWVRVQANMSLGAYEISEATGEIPEPEWPEHSLHDLLKIAFRGRMIETYDHPVLRRLRGEI